VTAAHRDFFASLQNRAYKGEAMSSAGIESAVLAAGLDYAGHIDTSGTLVLLPGHQQAREVWFLDRAARTARLIRRSPDASSAGGALPPFTPVFFIPIDRLNLIRTPTAARLRGVGPFFTES
jgi:hypothetical protein